MARRTGSPRPTLQQQQAIVLDFDASGALSFAVGVNQAKSLFLLSVHGQEHDSFLPEWKAAVMIMNISDIPTRIEAGSDEKRSLVTRIGELDETPVLTLVDTVEPSEAEPSKLPDPLIQALVDKLPKPNSIWSIDGRAKWLRAATMIFNLVYKLDEAKETDKIEQRPSVSKSAG